MPCKTKRKKRQTKTKLNPTDQKALATAKRMAKRFHGTEGQVVELSKKERKPLPRFVAVAGELEDFTYQPLGRSKRAQYKWKHESGDRGQLAKKSKNKPLLVVDPKSKRPAIVQHKSPMKFSSRRGFVG